MTNLYGFFGPSERAPRIIPEVEETSAFIPVIRVLGIGGAGGNALNRMIERGLQGVEFVAINTDAQDLQKSLAPVKIQIGHRLTKGLGAGGSPKAGETAALEDIERIREVIAGAQMIFLTAGLGGGTGSGATPVIAQEIRKTFPETLLVAVVTLPFYFEGPIRQRNAQVALTHLKKKVDAYIVIPNQNIVQIADPDLPLTEAFWMADEILYRAVEGLTDMIVRPGEINLDFADVYNVLKDQGRAVFGSGYAEGPDRAMKAVEMALHCPLLENTSIKDARNVLVHITGNRITLREVETACSYIYEFLHPEHSHMYFGYATRDESAGMRVTIIVSGFPNEPPTEKEESKSPGAAAEPIVATTRRTAVYYDGRTPTPTRLERVFDEATPESALEIDPEALRRPAIERKQPRYVFPGFRSRKKEEE